MVIFYLLTIASTTTAVNYIGCQFKSDLCEDREICYNDGAFGTCVSLLEADFPPQYKFSPESLQLLESEMERVWLLGYKWDDVYAQCVIQNVLYSQNNGFEYEQNLCNDISERQLILTPELDSDDVGVLKLSPSSYEYKHASPSQGLLEDVKFNELDYKPLDSSQLNSKLSTFFRERIQIPTQNNPNYMETVEEDEEQETGGNIEKKNSDDDVMTWFNSLPPKTQQEIIQITDDVLGEMNVEDDVEEVDGPFYDYPVTPHAELEQDIPDYNYFYDYEPVKGEPLYSDYLGLSDFNNDYVPSVENMMQNLAAAEEPIERYYRYSNDDNIDYPEYLSSMDKDYYERDGRIDVKKPGPQFLHTNNEENKVLASDQSDGSIADMKVLGFTESPIKSQGQPEIANYLVSPHKKSLTMPQVTDTKLDVIDMSYVYMEVKRRFSSWKEGSDLVHSVERKLNVPIGTFSNVRVSDKQVIFKVNPNSQHLNSSMVATVIEEGHIKSAVQKELGVEITATGIGDQAQVSSAIYQHDNRLFLITFTMCGVVAAVLLFAAVAYVIRRHNRSRDKLHKLATGDAEPSKDYQDLCRARMATKANEKPEPLHIAHRMLSKESDGSSRSSTSSWSEEPASSTMDISTGHMVLEYMEGHLKNKDRLEEEWRNLQNYTAEPNTTDISKTIENKTKNRYQDVVPYDHSRVLLNSSINSSQSAYINASSITDHDPRNPAYIATQGPTKATVADFWQLVWEQGSVVIVNLTKLNENKVEMCYQYWPEEGSEVYHIYEVHLVSEHIWCDDYLVRSFYLKNLRNGETRTVTQFHFLSWNENSIPSSIKTVLEFRRKCNKSYRGRSCPILVHCSDGAGRTGTYILIDMVLNRMVKGAKEIDIAATLEHIRDQRPGMVKTRGQFEFVLMAVAEEVHAILRALPQ